MPKRDTGSIQSEGLKHKLWIVYLLMFVLPTGYLLYIIRELGRTAGAAESAAIARIGMVLGVPAAIVMSVAAFVLLRHSASTANSVVARVESFLKDFRTFEVPPPTTRDETQQISHYVTCMIDEFRRHMSAIDRYAQELHDANQRLVDVALADTLTGLYNRKHALHMLEVEVQRAVKHEGSLSILLVDIDDIGAFRNENGDTAADDAVREIAQTVSADVRRVDMVARMEDGRFLVLLLETGKPGAATAAQRIRESVASRAFRAQEEYGISGFAVSVGAATHEGESDGAHDLLERASRALLLAQRSGTDTVNA